MSYLEIEPARAKSKKRLEGIWGHPEWIAEPKLDGWRFLMHFGGDLARVFLTGRRISSETGRFSEKGGLVPHLWPSVNMKYTVLDGEIMPPEGAGFRDLAAIMNSDPMNSAKAIERFGKPSYHVFDILFYDGRDLREECLAVRRQILRQLSYDVDMEHFFRVEAMPCEEQSFENIVSAGGEGLILKNLTDAYGEGWVKVKKASTLDVVVTGFTDAKFGVTGKYDGQIGAVVVSVYGSSGDLLEVGQVSGMTDELRLDISRRKGEWLGQVIEIEAQEWAKDRLRHPRWKRHRPDADARTCTYRKMMRDLGEEEELRGEETQIAEPKQGSLF